MATMAPPAKERLRDYGSFDADGVDISSKSRTSAKWYYAGVLAVSVVLLVQGVLMLPSSHDAKPSVLIGMGQLSMDKANLDNVAGEVSDDLDANTILNKDFSDSFAKPSASDTKCNCDCNHHPAEMQVKAATMLDQIGENIFFGPCAGCPCMKSSTLDGLVGNLRKELDEAEAQEKELSNLETSKLPVDIIMRVGRKGKDGAQGPKGYKGPDGPVGAPGPIGPTGPPGPKGMTGVTGPKGVKGPDGYQGPQGAQGIKGKPGIQGQRGSEGPDGSRGPAGPDGTNGKDGPPGNPGDPGPRGDAATVGAQGEQGQQGPRGPPGDKGPNGEGGDKGFAGTNGPDGPPGQEGARGSRGKIGKGCDGIRPNDGTPPKQIDACGICGGDESECAKGRAGRTAHAVGDPHYLTFDGKSFDYQVTGEFILSRHMNDIELQSMQRTCPNPAVRCNVGAAVITRNYNIIFKSEWRMDQIMVNGEMWNQGKDYHHGHRTQLNVFTSLLVTGSSFTVWFNDMAIGDGSYVYGRQNPWGAPLPNNLYMDLYFYAPGRWSSGLSMTGLFANFNYDYNDDWDSISPSSMWWVQNTKNNAFDNPEYLLDWGNRITKASMALKPTTGVPMLSEATADGFHENFKATKWTLEMEREALKEVSPLTSKMRKRLFTKMASDGAILRQTGEAKPVGLGAAELDIEDYPGERPDKLRVEQQMLFRKEWKTLNAVQRKSMLAGAVVSNNGVGMSQMCKECIDGSADCAAKSITKDPVAGVTWQAVTADGKDWTPEERKAECHHQCLPDRPVSNVICKCWLDCSLGNPAKQCGESAHWNLVLARDIILVPKTGEGHCINVNVAAAARYKAADYRPELWDKEDASNFVITMWYKPRPSRSCDDDSKTIHSILYKGPKEVDLQNEPVAIEVDASKCDQTSEPLLPVIATVAGQDLRSTNGISKDKWSFIAIMKSGKTVSLWLGVDGEVRKDSSMTIPDDVHYEAKESDAIYLVSPEATEPRIPYGWVGKVNYIPASLWDAEVPRMYNWKEPEDCGT